jgi:hypothetical protein
MNQFWYLVAAVFVAVNVAQPVHAASVYRCPGNPVLYTDAISAKEAIEKGCKMLDGAPITVIQGPKPRAAAGANSSSNSAAAPAGAASNRIDPAEQRARDSDARRILEAELKREEGRLLTMRLEYNNGEPERLGSERNAQKYQDRIAQMKEALARKESDVASLKRELAKP